MVAQGSPSTAAEKKLKSRTKRSGGMSRHTPEGRMISGAAHWCRDFLLQREEGAPLIKAFLEQKAHMARRHQADVMWTKRNTTFSTVGGLWWKSAVEKVDPLAREIWPKLKQKAMRKRLVSKIGLWVLGLDGKMKISEDAMLYAMLEWTKEHAGDRGKERVKDLHKIMVEDQLKEVDWSVLGPWRLLNDKQDIPTESELAEENFRYHYVEHKAAGVQAALEVISEISCSSLCSGVVRSTSPLKNRRSTWGRPTRSSVMRTTRASLQRNLRPSFIERKAQLEEEHLETLTKFSAGGASMGSNGDTSTPPKSFPRSSEKQSRRPSVACEEASAKDKDKEAGSSKKEGNSARQKVFKKPPAPGS